MPTPKQQKELEESLAIMFPEWKAKLELDKAREQAFLNEHVRPSVKCGKCGAFCRIQFDAKFGADTYHCAYCGYANYVEH